MMYKVFSVFSFILLTACSASKLNDAPKVCLSNYHGKIFTEYSNFLRVRGKPFKIESFLKSKEECVGLFLGYYKSNELNTTEKVIPILKTNKQVLFYNPVSEESNKSIINLFKSELTGSSFTAKEIDSIEQRFLKGVFIINKI